MKPPPTKEGFLRQVLSAFLVALAIYAVAFYLIEYRRRMKGPWEITFTTDATGQPTLAIAQPYFGIAEKLIFPGGHVAQTNFAATIRFTEFNTNLPFGEFLYQDALYLPGDLTFDLCGHQIEMIPRTLILDQKEQPWQTNATLTLPVK